MSYTKQTFKNQILDPVNKIQDETINNIDLTKILEYLNQIFYIKERIIEKDQEIGELWNEIIFDLLSSIHSASSGFYRSAIVTLRSILEIGCYSIYYYDHKIEYSIFQSEDIKADKYVSILVNNFEFFKTRYIKSFYPNIGEIQKKADSVSEYLLRKYGELSDVVHGRYKSLIKIKDLNINYSKGNFKKYEKLLCNVLSILSVLYILRFDDFSNKELKELVSVSGVINYE
ncbi:hypothetical protein [Clostridium beijerinckii]|uniref:hypothetical protein n=1 Tax=Clostridium beijerinckii TaxID=1520 RepID=UPI001494CDD6|nr:hypothetical protein [Clostridium beijerinckii]NOW07653.1 hypothetical protein [Clostridium beijerinckii]NYC04574.1 hypothetical protein [Clostridium beijerinckii]